MLIHTYYGLNATGGPAGVGEAVGRAIRTSLIASQWRSLLVPGSLRPVRQLQLGGMTAHETERALPDSPAWWAVLLVACASSRSC